MTYDELAALIGCSATDVRLRINHLSLDRRKSRDGITRIKLNLALTAKFFEMIKKSEYDLNAAIDDIVIYNRALSAAEVFAQSQAVPEPSTGLLAILGCTVVVGWLLATRWHRSFARES